jgi:glycosyltransferase involved in cell wall biosynthesis
MRLVIDLQGAQGGNRARGVGRYVRELAIAMARAPRDHEVIVALNGALPETAEALAATFAGILPAAGIRVWHPPPGIAGAPAAPQRDFAEALRAHVLAALQPDLVHVGSLFEGFDDDVVSLQPARLERLPVVATCFDLIPLIRHEAYFGAPGTAPAARWYYRCLHELALSEGLLAISDSSRTEAVRHLPFAPERVFNIQAGVSADFRPADLSPAARAALLRRYGLREPFILFLGAGERRKNEAGLLAAYARLPQALRDRHQLLIVGKVDQAALRKAAAALHIPAANVAIVAFVPEPDLAALYSACALFVFPSLHEGFGFPVAEAMACGAPAIASNTTSLPEVVGRADATFDPADPDAIAACMRKVLENPGFRDALAAHGPVQAARFTWQSSAARAWDALEQIHARRQPPHSPAHLPASLPPRRPRLAFVSPLPPQASGIADYSAELLPSLARHYDITLVSEAEAGDIRLQAALPHLGPAGFLQHAAQFDRVLYQVGNSSFHRFQMEELLPNCPGVVVLHDAAVSDYLNWLAHRRDRPDDFRAALLHAHGYPALVDDAANGREAAVARYPCSLAVLQAAVGVIQHSQHGVDVLRVHFGAAATRDIAVIPLLRADRWRPDRAAARAALGLPADAFVVCSFGVVTPMKCPALLAEAWRRTGLAGQLVFVGDAAPERQRALADAAAGIHCTGRLARAQYAAWLAAADIAVQWRTGSRGESSAAVADALVAGLPLIVNRHGAAAELPGQVVHALPDDADAPALAAAIVALHADAPRRAALSAAARAYALRELAPEAAAQRYRAAIEAAYAAAQPAVIAQRLAQEARSVAALPGGLPAAASAIGRSFAGPWRAGGRPRLLVDMSELARRDAGTGIQRVVREIGRRALLAPPAGREGEVRQGGAVRADRGRLRHTYAAPLRLLGLAPLALPETPVDAGAGDVLLCADVNPELTAAEFADLRRLRLDGMRIVLLVYDLLPMRHPDLFPPGIAAVSDWYTRMLTIADGVACISRAVADDLVAWLGAHPGHRTAKLPIGYFHLGADFPAAAAAATPGVRQALASAGRRPTVVMTGTIEPRKGYAQALEAFERLWQADEEIGLTIVGKQGWQMDAFVARLQASPALGDRLHWLPHCSDAELQQLYRAGAGLLMASGHEGFGLPIVEAAQARLPVLARDLPVFREVAGEAARYFTGDRPEGLAAALRRWMADGFAPSPDGIRPLSWDDSFRQLCATILDGQWYTIWQP